MRVQQSQGTAHQNPVDVRIDLREIGRIEWHGDAKLGEYVGQLGRAGCGFIQQLDSLRAFGLQPPLNHKLLPLLQAPLLQSERTQFGQIAVAQGLQMPQYQRDDIIAPHVTHCQFDLRHSLFRVH